MLDFLFRRLTAGPSRGADLFETLTRLARQPHWYVEGEVPDTLDGRFAVLSTVMALVMVRLEADGDEGNRESVALTERFVEVMESEHRELGIGDPTLGRTVRKLVGSLSRRTDMWRKAVNGEADWTATASESLYRDKASPGALRHASGELQALWSTLESAGLARISEGMIE